MNFRFLCEMFACIIQTIKFSAKLSSSCLDNDIDQKVNFQVVPEENGNSSFGNYKCLYLISWRSIPKLLKNFSVDQSCGSTEPSGIAIPRDDRPKDSGMKTGECFSSLMLGV